MMDRMHTGRMLIVFRLLLTIAAFVVCYGVFAPLGTAPSLMPWDKAAHFTAFYGLAFLAMHSFPRTPLWLLATMLSAWGVAIELIQALPIVHRECDVLDWAADTLGVAAGMAPLLASRWRRELSTAPGRLPTD